MWFKSGNCKTGLDIFIHGITHDLSKFTPHEFIPYAKWFYGKYGVECKNYISKWENHIEKPDGYWDKLKKLNKICKLDFDYAWLHHYKRNKHHWNHWYSPISNKCENIPDKYIIQMILDWKAMGMKFNNTPQEYYLNNYNEIKLTNETRMNLEYRLGLNDSLVNNYGHTLKQFVGMYEENVFNKYFGYIKGNYNVDIYTEIKKGE